MLRKGAGDPQVIYSRIRPVPDYRSRALGADCVLLIVSALDDVEDGFRYKALYLMCWWKCTTAMS